MQGLLSESLNHRMTAAQRHFMGPDSNATGGDAGSTFIGGPGNETFYGGGADTFFGGTGTDTVWGSGAPSTFITGSGTDFFYGGSEQGGWSAAPNDGDTFIANGQGGTHLLQGNYQDDTYIVDAGSGTIDIFHYWANGTLILGSGLTAADVSFAQSGNDLIITDGTFGDTIDLESQYAGRQMQTLIFGDGETISLTQGNTIHAVGDGAFDGGLQNDIIYGGTGTETLAGISGNDSYVADAGTETINSGLGNDTYAYASGDGAVTINDAGGANTLKLGSGLTQANVTLTTSGPDLLITDGVSGDEIDIVGEFVVSAGATPPSVQTIVFGDGTVEHLPDIVSADNATVTLSLSNTVLQADGSGDVLVGNNPQETLIAGTGSTTLQGGSSADVYSYRRRPTLVDPTEQRPPNQRYRDFAKRFGEELVCEWIAASRHDLRGRWPLPAECSSGQSGQRHGQLSCFPIVER